MEKDEEDVSRIVPFQLQFDKPPASQKTIFSVGMIFCEEEGRLKEKPIMLQSSVEHSEGQCVHFELQKLEQFSIFPGQVVGVEGHNPSGHCLIATKIVDYVPLSVPDDTFLQTKRQAVDQDNQLVDPFDVSSDLSLVSGRINYGVYVFTPEIFTAVQGVSAQRKDRANLRRLSSFEALQSESATRSLPADFVSFVHNAEVTGAHD